MPLVHTCCFLEPARLIAAIDLCELPPQPSAEPPMAVNATEGIRAGFHGVTAQSAALHYFIIYSPNSGTAENGVQGDNRRWSLPHSGTAENGVQAGGSEREHTTVDEARQGEVGVCDRYRTPVSTPLYAVPPYCMLKKSYCLNASYAATATLLERFRQRNVGRMGIRRARSG